MRIGKTDYFAEKNFRRMLKSIIGGYGTPKFHGENFAGGSKTAKFVKVFFLKSFLLYGIQTSQVFLCVK